MTLVLMRVTAFRNAVLHRPWRYGVAAIALALAGWGIFAAARWAIAFLDGLPAIGAIADAVVQRSLEGLFLTLMVGVAFSVLTSAITTLYASSDLPFLLSLPVAPVRVFGLKVVEVFLSSAAVPAALTIPVLLAVAVERDAAWTFMPVALLATLTSFSLPVALGCSTALILMRIAPAGRAHEVATAANVVLAAGLVVALRVLRPERLGDLDLVQFEAALMRFSGVQLGSTPPSWAADAVWAALDGRVAASWWAIAASALSTLVAVAWAAAWAYRRGWMRALDTRSLRFDDRRRPVAAWERLLGRLGPVGAMLVKDVRIAGRDPMQWSQVLVLVALAVVYLVSTGSIDVDGQRFRDALGTMNVAFTGFLLVGVGVRTTFPSVSLEGEGWWMLRTAPVSTTRIVLAKAGSALPGMLALGVGLGIGTAMLLDVSAPLAVASPWAGAGAALVTCGLGVGLGAAWPRFTASSPAEVPFSPGGLAYMGLGTVYAVGQTVLLAWPAWASLQGRTDPVWSTFEGVASIALAFVWTAAFTAVPLVYGIQVLSRRDHGDE